MRNSFKKVKLDNGLRIIIISEEYSLATMVMVLVEAGSKYESKDINGLSHFLEHVSLKGTKKRPTQLQIASELEGLGAQYNAFTSHEFTGYYAKARNENFPQILDVVADTYLNPVFDPEQIDKERGPIIEEINMYEDILPRKVQDLIMELAYGDQPAGWPITGTKENIRKLQKEDFINYREKNYLANSTIVIVSGGVNLEEVREKVERSFEGLNSGAKHAKIGVLDKQDKPKSLVSYKSSDQTHLVFGFRAFPINDERRFALELLGDILGGGISSRLFQKIRSDLGAAYYIDAASDLFTDHGLFLISAGVDHQKIEAVIKEVLNECRLIKEKGVGEKELERAKNHVIGNIFLSLETSDQMGKFYGIQEVLGLSIKTPEETASKIQAVTSSDIQNLAKSIFENDRLNLALVGPFKDKNFLDILKI